MADPCAPAALRPAGRDAAADKLRGLAIILMALDHLLAVFAPVGGMALRLTVTRLAAPVFMVLAGHFWRPTSSSSERSGVLERPARSSSVTTRRLQLVGAGLVVTACFGALGLDVPDIVLIWLALSLAVMPLVARWPAGSLVLGLLWAIYLPVPWHAYQPGLIVAYAALGRLATPRDWSWANHLPAFFGQLGRRPLTWYVGHVLALTLLAAAVWS